MIPAHPLESRLSEAWPVSAWLDSHLVVAVSGGPDSVGLLRAILAIKQVAAASDVYHRGVSSVDIYTAVLDDGVASPEEFVAWLAASGRTL